MLDYLQDLQMGHTIFYVLHYLTVTCPDNRKLYNWCFVVHSHYQQEDRDRYRHRKNVYRTKWNFAMVSSLSSMNTSKQFYTSRFLSVCLCLGVCWCKYLMSLLLESNVSQNHNALRRTLSNSNNSLAILLNFFCCRL